MQRRDFITGGIAGSAFFQEDGHECIYQDDNGLKVCQQHENREQLDAQYEICKQRGHVATINIPGPSGGILAVYIAPPPPSPANVNGRYQETQWQTCWYCKKEYRYVTKIEEK